MRSPFLIALGFFCITLPVSHSAYATGNVLVPSSSDQTTSSLPNLGIEPAQTDNSSAESPAPVTTPPPSAPTTGSMQTLAPTNVPSATVNPDDFQKAVSASSLKSLAPGKIPTTIIHQPDMSAILAQANSNLPTTLTVSIGPKSMFGFEDVKTISDKLGLTRDQISSSCFMSIRGMIKTDKGSYFLGGSLKGQQTIHYAGMIQSYLMSTLASCAVKNLPAAGGIITETDGRYIVPLQAVQCAPPTRQVSRLVITYTGTSSSSCEYD